MHKLGKQIYFKLSAYNPSKEICTILVFLNYTSELKTLEWWISGLRLKPLFFLISSLNIACSPHEFKLQRSKMIGQLDISF